MLDINQLAKHDDFSEDDIASLAALDLETQINFLGIKLPGLSKKMLRELVLENYPYKSLLRSASAALL